MTTCTSTMHTWYHITPSWLSSIPQSTLWHLRLLSEMQQNGLLPPASASTILAKHHLSCLNTNMPTFKTNYNKANDKHQSWLESGLWIAIDSKNTALTTCLLEKHSTKVRKLSANLTICKGTSKMCEKEVHKSPKCPAKINHTPDTQKKKNKEHNKKPTAMFLHSEWQEEDWKVVRVRKLFKVVEHGCGVICASIGAYPHSASTHRGPNISKANNNASKGLERHEECQGNLAEIVVENNNSSNLVMSI